jgi:hypothetical protein
VVDFIGDLLQLVVRTVVRLQALDLSEMDLVAAQRLED